MGKHIVIICVRKTFISHEGIQFYSKGIQRTPRGIQISILL